MLGNYEKRKCEWGTVVGNRSCQELYEGRQEEWRAREGKGIFRKTQTLILMGSEKRSGPKVVVVVCTFRLNL